MLSFDTEILGTKYAVRMGTKEDLSINKDFAGDCDFIDKVIRIRTDVELDEQTSVSRRERFVKNTFCHEMAHAFLYESGLCDLASDEMIIQWLEVNSRKFVDTVNGLDDKVGDLFKQLDKERTM